MELHAPGGPVHSLQDFAVHLGIVTLGILIALGLEQIVQMHHRTVIARTSFTYAIDAIGQGTLHSCDQALGSPGN